MKMERNQHSELKEFWKEVGIALGFDVIVEFKVDHDSIDVVWKKDNDMIFIEIEDSEKNKNQLWKNMTKGIHLRPKMIIFDCLNFSIAKFIESKKNRLDIPVKTINRNNKILVNFEKLQEKIDKQIEEKLKEEESIAFARKNIKRKKLLCFKCRNEIKFGTTFLIKNKKPIHPVCILEDKIWD